jgi:hypothetical protein
MQFLYKVLLFCTLTIATTGLPVKLSVDVSSSGNIMRKEEGLAGDSALRGDGDEDDAGDQPVGGLIKPWNLPVEHVSGVTEEHPGHHHGHHGHHAHHHTGGDNCEDHTTKKSAEEYLLEGSFCEELCVDPTSKLTLAAGLQPGTCAQQGFNTFKAKIDPKIFATADRNDLPDAGTYTMTSGCNPHYKVSNTLCEMFCIEDASLADYSEHVAGICPGMCPAAYTKYVGSVTMQTFVLPGAGPSPAAAACPAA